MVEESKKSGNCYNFEPLHHELNDTFGCMKNVTPDSVFSTIKGLQVKPNTDQTNAEEGDEDETQLVAPSTSTTNNDDKKKPSKSMWEPTKVKITLELCNKYNTIIFNSIYYKLFQIDNLWFTR